ncbi:MAG: hypothetical protein KDL87_20210, partial [Verrucomicrobiae bacterium]|nr:hypothetical protein [Verrucomicrobiae bacterium]
YVYSFDGGQSVGSQWSIAKKLVASNVTGDDRFGYDVDVNGGVVVVGARQEDTGGSNRGSVYVYNFDTTNGGVGAVIGSGDNNRVRFITLNTDDTITVEFVNAGANQTLAVAEAAGVVTVTLATDGAGAITSTAADVAAAVNNLALTGANGGILLATEASHGTGTAVVAASAGPVTLEAGYELQALNSLTGIT